MKAAAKALLERIAPRQFAVMQAIRARRNIAQLQEQWGLAQLSRDFASKHGEIVSGGPFAGMRLPYDESFAGYIAMLVGSLEQEVHGVVSEVLKRHHKCVINVGCAEGYYAVGLALKDTNASVHAYDIDPWARRYCAKLAELNGVKDRVYIHGWCGHAAISSVAGNSTLIVCDCEGYEAELLDPAACPILSTADILVELHDFARPGGVTELIRDRFTATHDISIIPIAPRDSSAFPQLEMLPKADRLRAITETRNPNSRWAWLSSRK